MVDNFHANWISVSLRKPAFLHAMMCLTALQLILAQPNMQPSPVDLAAYHRVKAINAVREALADREQAVSDETIAAVFHLLCFEENLFNPALSAGKMRPDTAQRAAHVRGLREMIRLRGGISGLSSGTGKVLRVFILRYEEAASRRATNR